MHPVRRLLAIVTALVFVTGAFGRAAVAWTCEGRVCSSDLARCCCASSERDRSCATPSVASASACKGRCACTAVPLKSFGTGVVQASKGVHAIASVEIASSPTPAPVFLAQAFVRLDTPQLRAIPPPHRLPDPPGIEHASLRAPPATA